VKLIGRLRRASPEERVMILKGAERFEGVLCPTCGREKFSSSRKTIYMREYMRRRRAKQRGAAAGEKPTENEAGSTCEST